jgi:hypothetical protein
MVYPPGMATSPKPTVPQDPRAERLAAALRENLKRRKAQARAKEQTKTANDKEHG